MHKKVLSEVSLFYGDVEMPKGWDIDRDKLSGDILQSVIQNKEFPFSRTWDMLNTYMRDHIGLEYGINLINKNSWGDIYKPNQTSKPLLDVDPVDLRNSPDFTLLYGVKVNINDLTSEMFGAMDSYYEGGIRLHTGFSVRDYEPEMAVFGILLSSTDVLFNPVKLSDFICIIQYLTAKQKQEFQEELDKLGCGEVPTFYIFDDKDY